jgi:hypothetical protein
MNTGTDSVATYERALRFFVAAIALAEFGAIAGVFMPVSLMAAVHAWLGLGTMPDGALVPYLARSLSAFYVVHGGVMMVCATDVRRYAPMIAYLAWAGIAFAVMVTVLDTMTGFPWYWTLIEGPGLIVLSVIMLVLLRRIGSAPDGAASGR